MGITIEAAIARTGKYATRESGDGAEMVERPGGGLSIVMIDGQGSGLGARALCQALLATSVNLIKEGVRDGVVARAVHDQLYTLRNGQVSATIDIVSVDLRTRTVLVTRNATTPLLIGREGRYQLAPCGAPPIGLSLRLRPAIWEIGMEPDLSVVVCTDGVTGSGLRKGHAAFNVEAFVDIALPSRQRAAEIADGILAEAIRRDDGRPGDDMTVVALRLNEHDHSPLIRTQTAVVHLP